MKLRRLDTVYIVARGRVLCGQVRAVYDIVFQRRRPPYVRVQCGNRSRDHFFRSLSSIYRTKAEAEKSL